MIFPKGVHFFESVDFLPHSSGNIFTVFPESFYSDYARLAQYLDRALSSDEQNAEYKIDIPDRANLCNAPGELCICTRCHVRHCFGLYSSP